MGDIFELYCILWIFFWGQYFVLYFMTFCYNAKNICFIDHQFTTTLLHPWQILRTPSLKSCIKYYYVCIYWSQADYSIDYRLDWGLNTARSSLLRTQAAWPCLYTTTQYQNLKLHYQITHSLRMQMITNLILGSIDISYSFWSLGNFSGQILIPLQTYQQILDTNAVCTAAHSCCTIVWSLHILVGGWEICAKIVQLPYTNDVKFTWLMSNSFRLFILNCQDDICHE